MSLSSLPSLLDRFQRGRRSIPEVIQTSAMDCGPAALGAVLRGFGHPVDYRELRQHCQTAVDGTSIDVLEEVARAHGLGAEQVMLPPDFILDPRACALPAIAVTSNSLGFTHFVVAWKQRGSRLQVMDPETGRRWMDSRAWKRDLYLHSAHVPASGWREWAGGEEYQRVLSGRLRDLGGSGLLEALEQANRSPHWQPLARLEAALRLGEALLESRALRRGREAARLVLLLLRQDEAQPGEALPLSFWSVQSAPPTEEGEEALLFRGAVLLRFSPGEKSHPGPSPAPPRSAMRPTPALAEHPFRSFFRLLREWEPRLLPLLLLATVALAAAVALEALFLYGLGNLWPLLGTRIQQGSAVFALALFLGFLLLVEYGVASLSWRFGRHLEILFRTRLLSALPRIPDLYFQTRPASDMAHRMHLLYQIRSLAATAMQLFASSAQVLFLAVAITWASPATGPATLLALPLLIGLPLLLLPGLQEADLRARTHSGSLSRFFLDALLGIRVIRSHGAEKAVLREHEGLLAEWMRSSYARDRRFTAFMAQQGILGLSLAFLILYLHLRGAGGGGMSLLVGYWVLALTNLGSEIGGTLQRLPLIRNTLLRVLELAQSAEPVLASPAGSSGEKEGVHLHLRGVQVTAAGQPILRNLTLEIQPGEHVAILGPSGAGKSTLVSLLLGWHQPSEGEMLLDGEPLQGERLAALRRETAWIEPQIQLWNRSLSHNVTYGLSSSTSHALGEALRASQVTPLLSRLPEGLQHQLGEGGGLLSGGEGQRTRIARALLRPEARLVVLDEAMRGLDRAMRLEILSELRHRWRQSTLLCVTHDIAPSLDFDQVLIVEDGEVVERGAPRDLLQTPGSRYRTLLEAEAGVAESLWRDERWRVVRVQEGRLHENRLPEARP